MAVDASVVRAVVFDAFGTLLDFESVAKRCPSLPEEAKARWPEISEIWRTKQLSYTWLLSLMGPKDPHKPFDEVTRDALLWTLDKVKITALEDDAGMRAMVVEELLAAYGMCQAFADVVPTLGKLKASGRFKLAILSNGSVKMLQAAAGAAGLTSLLDDVISVEAQAAGPPGSGLRGSEASSGGGTSYAPPRVYFKPHPAVYQLALDRLGLGSPTEVTFVSSNGWDIHGAAAFGFTCVWVNRGGVPDDTGLPGKPAAVLASLSELPAVLGV